MSEDSDIKKKTRYHINLFSDYGIRRNTQSDITKWRYMTGTERDDITKWTYSDRRRMSAYTGDAACHLAMAYIDGNGVGVDINLAKFYLALGSDRGHRFCIFKWAEVWIEEHILRTGGVSPSIHSWFNQLAEMARLGVGEASVSLYFLLKKYGQTLEAQGWECSKAYEITNMFMWALQLAYQYKPGESYHKLISALHDLGELGSGAAYFQAGKILEVNEQYIDALESYQLGSLKCFDKKCIGEYIKHARGEEQLLAIKWAREKCPISLAYFYEFHLLVSHARENGIDLNLEENNKEILKALEAGFAQCINEEYHEGLETGIKLAEDLLNGPSNDPTQAKVNKVIDVFLLTLRRIGLQNHELDICLSRSIIDHHNDGLLNFGFKKECIRKAEESKLRSDKLRQLYTNFNPLDDLDGGHDGLDKIALKHDTFAEVEFRLIEEHGKLTLGCARGNYYSLYVAMICSLYQTKINPRKKPAVIDSHRSYYMAYAYLHGAELVSGKEIIGMQELKEISLKIDRQVIDAHMAKENERWNEIKSRQTFIDWIGRGGRYSQRLFNEINYSYDTPAGQFQPWRPVIGSKAKPDQLALTWNHEVLSACPIDRNWIFYPNSNLLKPCFDKPLEDHINHLIELTKAGTYDLAKQAYTWWKFTIVETGIGTNGKFTYLIRRPEDSIQLAVIAREMLFRGDYEESEKIIDYLIYTELSPGGLLHHISAWLKYKQGKLSEAIIMLQDEPEAALAESLNSQETNANILEYRLLLTELLLRDERLREAAANIIKLKEICENSKIYDKRISQLSEKIQDAFEEITGERVELHPFIIDMMSMMGIPNTFSKNGIGLMAQVPYFGQLEVPPNNMDRYRCLFPK